MICSSMSTSNIIIIMTGRTLSSFLVLAQRSQSQRFSQMTVRAFNTLFIVSAMIPPLSIPRTADPATEGSESRYISNKRPKPL